MNDWDRHASVELLEALLAADRLTEAQYEEATQRLSRGELCEGVQYALQHAGIG